MNAILRLPVVLVCVGACSIVIGDDPSLTKAEARELAEQDKADGIRIDYCEIHEWYDDSVCDEFCLDPDPDCDVDGAQACGGPIEWTCDTGDYCKYGEAQSCGADEALGVCHSMPEVCTKELMPVCGCDGQTYGNGCEAASAGVSIESVGACDDDVAVCGVRGAEPCDDEEYCAFSESAECGAADAPGVCMTRPEVCTEIYAPVCGCDGQTYGNDCFAAVAGVSVAYDGECDAA